MKNTIFKSIFALFLAFMALPMMGQDYMNIFFKDGRHHKFYLRDITSISTSKYDADGVMHSNYEFQHITTLENKYVYNLFDIDSIYFSKYNEELALKNISSASSTIFPSLAECKTIEDAEKQIGIIENADGVEKVWSDGNDLYVKISNWETMSFHFSHNDDEEEDNSMSNVESLKKVMSSTLGTVFSPNGNYRRAVIANQQRYDEKYNRPYLYYLKESFEKCGIIVDYPKDPTLDFFWNNSEDPQNLNLYDYDIVFLLTHGGYDDVTGTHGLMAADYLGEELVHWTEPSSSNKVKWEEKLKELRKKYTEVTDEDVILRWTVEIRDAIPYWIAYPVILESFFDKAEGHFRNEKSIWFNCACSSLEGDESNDGVSSSMVDKFLGKDLGIYLGYAKRNSSGAKTGYNFFTNMLSGQSLFVALSGAIPFISIDEIKEILDGSRTSTVTTASKLSKEDKYSMTLFPTITKKVDQETATNSFNKSNCVEVEGNATSINYNDLSSIGFLYGTDDKLSSSQEITDVEIVELTKPLDNGYGNISFRGKITDLIPGTNYYYCAYTYDGMYYNCGDTCSFCIYPALTLSVNKISIEEDTFSTIDITSGSGTYSIEKIEPAGVVTASISENCIVIKALTAGFAIITVKDDKSGETATIEVTVTENSGPVSYLACPDDHHPHLIDLGLPSGTKWACCNVDSDPTKQTPPNYGGYYAWGETEEKDYYDWSTYIHCDGDESTCHDLGSDIAGTEYDVAHVKWGDSWVMPSLDQIRELLDKCTYTWTALNGVNGGQFSGPNGGAIFLPATGVRYREVLKFGDEGIYWSSSPMQYYPSVLGYADILSFSSSKADWGPFFCSWGFTVRPVYVDDVDNKSHLQLSTTTLALATGLQGTVEVTSGSGSYDAESNAKDVATVTVDGAKLTIKAVAPGSATIIVKDNQTQERAKIEVTVSETPPSSLTCPDSNHPHAIDLGLPSGTRWACCNVDTDHPENQAPTNYGGYYAWGETETKSTYSDRTYKYYPDGNYANLGSDIAGTQYDVAHNHWGESWVMPSLDQIKELMDKCSSEWTNINGVNGRRFTGNNGGTIFMPAAGVRWDDDHYDAGTYGNYWASTQNPMFYYDADEFTFYSDSMFWVDFERCYGQSVRPVWVP